VLMAFIVMYYQGVNANIMSLGGIAIAIGAMVDAAVVMIENAHKHIEAWHHAHPDQHRQHDRRTDQDGSCRPRCVLAPSPRTANGCHRHDDYWLLAG